MLTEYVRIALRRHILRRLNPEGKPLPILRIGEGIENLVRESIRQTAIKSILRCRLVIRRRSCNLSSRR